MQNCLKVKSSKLIQTRRERLLKERFQTLLFPLINVLIGTKTLFAQFLLINKLRNSSFSVWLWLFLIVVAMFWLFRMIKAVCNITGYVEIRSFYSSALNIETV